METAIVLILKALATGVVAASINVGKAAMQDAYSGLKSLIQKRFAQNEEAKNALKYYEKKPMQYKEILAEQLQQTGAAEDKEIATAAEKVIHIAEQNKAELERASVTIYGDSYGTIMNNLGTVTQTFNFGQRPNQNAGE